MDGAIDAAVRTRDDQGGAGLDAPPHADAAGAASGAEQLHRKPRRAANPPRDRKHRSARVCFLLRARARVSAAVWLLRGCVHPPARAVRHRRAHGSRRLPRHRQPDMCAQGRTGERPAGWSGRKVTAPYRCLSGAFRRGRGTTTPSVGACASFSQLGVLLAGALAMVCGASGRLFAQPANRILVMPFDDVKREARIFWLTEGSASALSDDLNALGASAITRQERVQAFDHLQVPPAAALTDATVIRLGQLVGAAEVVVGSLQMENDTLVVRARSIALDTGRVRADVTERGPLPELFATFERIARRMGLPSATSSADIEKQPPPVTVFEAFIKGLLAETPATAISY